MARLEYSQTLRKKLKRLQNELVQNYGEHNSKKIMGKIMERIRLLATFPQSGTRISSQYDIECDYSYIFVEHNYFFYIIKDKDTVIILEMFHEKEDFMRNLFGIVASSQDGIDYLEE